MCSSAEVILFRLLLALTVLTPLLPAEPRGPNICFRGLPLSGVHSKGGYTYYGGTVQLNSIRFGPQRRFLWAATSRGVLRLDVEKEKLFRFSTLDGLPDTYVTDVDVSRGSVWAATFGGLCRLDSSGRRLWKNSAALTPRRAYRVTTDSLGMPWVALRSPPAISTFQGGTWTHYSWERDGLALAGVDFLQAGLHGNLWAVVWNGQTSTAGPFARSRRRSTYLLEIRADGTLRKVLLPQFLLALQTRRPITSLAVTADNHLAAGSPLGLFLLGNKGWTPFSTRNGLPDDFVLDLCQGPKSQVWGLTRKGIFRFDGTRTVLEAKVPPAIDAQYNLSQIVVGPDGDVWLAQKSPGLLVRGFGENWTIYAPELDGPRASDRPSIRRIVGSEDGRVFCAASGRNGGLSRGKDGKWKVLLAGNAEDVAVMPGGEVWAVLDGKVQRSAGEEWVPMNQKLDLHGSASFLSRDLRRHLWIGGPSDLIEWDGIKTVRHAGDTSSLVPAFRTVSCGTSGQLWVWGGQGIHQWKGGKQWRTLGKKQGLPGLFGSVLRVGPRGIIYLGGSWGAASFDGQKWQSFAEKRHPGLEAFPVLPGREVTDILIDSRGAAWFATKTGGVTRYDGRTWKEFRARDGLASNNVSCLAEIGEEIWFGTLAGITRLQLQDR